MEEIEKVKSKAKKDFGKKLTKLIEKSKKRKCDICNDLKIPQTTMSDWCLGKAYPRIRNLLLLANYFEIPYEELISTNTKKNKDFFTNDYKLCYIDGQKAYFTSNFQKQWGDDWNDRPYESNAGEPYEHYFEENIEYPIELESLYFETHDWNEQKPCDMGRFSVQDINRGAVAWVITDKFCIQAGTTMENFIKTIEENGGNIWRKNK